MSAATSVKAKSLAKCEDSDSPTRLVPSDEFARSPKRVWSTSAADPSTAVASFEDGEPACQSSRGPSSIFVVNAHRNLFRAKWLRMAH